MKKVNSTRDQRFATPLVRTTLVTLTYMFPTILITIIPTQSDIISRLLFIPVYLAYTWFFVKVLDKQSWKVLKLGLTKGAIKGFFGALALTAVIITLVTIINSFVTGTGFRVTQDSTLSHLFLAFLSSFVVQGFPEELIYRGYVEQTLNTTYNVKKSILIATTFFALMHSIHLLTGDVVYGLITVFVAFSFGFLASILKNLFQSTWAAVAVHGGFHLTRKLFELFGLEVTSILFLSYGILLFLVSIFLFYRYKDRFEMVSFQE